MTTSVVVPGAVDVAPTVSESRGEASAALYPIALLIDELRSEDVDLRVNAMNQLDHIACALGPVRTREELLPFLTELVVVEGTWVVSFGKVLNADFMQWLGGAQYGQCLLRPLEELANSDDEPRREEAVKSLISIAKVSSLVLLLALPLNTLETYYVPMLRNMAASDWFCQRAVAVALLPAVVSRLCARKKGSGGGKIIGDPMVVLVGIDPPLALELVNTLFTSLGADDSPMVRRAVFQVLGDIAAAVFPVSDTVNQLTELFKCLARDEQESVRILTVPVCIQLGKCLAAQPYEIVKDLLPSIHSCGEDQHSWRVRYMVADKIEDVIEAVPE
ncbi:Serine/threonine-protein phosphatase 2A 65 kDa regulatory subunit A beta isoform, putative, partial [Perkinsus marinus ATCC 50983]